MSFIKTLKIKTNSSVLRGPDITNVDAKLTTDKEVLSMDHSKWKDVSSGTASCSSQS